MGATFSRVKTWVKEKLKYSELNAEFDNIINNFTPAGMDDLSSNTAAMQGTQDPYPAGSPSLATSLAGELQRLRYLIAQITGEAYWYVDPDSNIAALYSSLQAISEWMTQPDTPTYIDGTSFSVPTDLTAVYTAGRRIKATVTAGTIYGTIISSAFTTVTTVTIMCDSGSLDSGLSAVSLGIITPGLITVPRVPTVEKTDDYVITIADFATLIIANKATAIAFTIPAATDVPPGWHVPIFNSGAGLLTLTGTINGVTNPTLTSTESCVIYSDGSAWKGVKSSSHTQSHAMTSSSDHTAGNWKVFHSNGSGVLVELALGAAGVPLIGNGAAAAPTFGQVKAAGIEDGAVNGGKLSLITSGTGVTILSGIPATPTSTSATYEKKWQYQIKRSGTIKITGIFLSSSLTQGYGKFCKNGVDYGSEYGPFDDSPGAAYDFDMDVSYNDTIEIWLKRTSGGGNVWSAAITFTCNDPDVGVITTY